MPEFVPPWTTFKPSKAAHSFIKKQEGYSATVYADTGGRRAGGWGHQTQLPLGTKMRRSYWETCFERDMLSVETCLERHVKVGLSQDQIDALASFIFNLGCGNFERSTLLRYLNIGDYEGASAEFPRWNHADGQVNLVLATRRALEREIFDRS